MSKKLFLNIDKVPITEAGIRHFYWPINAAIMHQAYVRLLHALIPCIRRAKNNAVNGVDSAMILYHYFMIELMSLYEASLLLSHSERDKISWLHAGTNPWVNIIQENKSADASCIIQRLLQAPTKPLKYRAPLRFMRDLLVSKREGMVRRSIKPCDYSKDIISLTINPLAIQHAKEIPDKVYYQRDSVWFQKLNSISEPSAYSELIDNLLRCVVNTFDDLSEQLRNYLKEWLSLAIPLTDGYMRQLQEKIQVPKRLWVGTAGHLWGRILARHVRNQGGHVTRFDHGSGAAYFYSLQAQGNYDCEDCDTFFTFSQNQAEGIKEVFTTNDIIEENSPDIKGFFSNKKSSVPEKSSEPPNRIKKIMYVASIYPNGYFYPAAKGFMRNHVLLDWEVRLMAKLKNWGYEVLFKPHPTDDICLEPPKSIEELLGPVRINQPFEEIYEQADLILLDDPSTSLLSTLVKSDKPAVYMDFGVTQFSPKAQLLIEKRFAIVKGHYNDKNRAIIEWEALKQAIETAQKYIDKCFYYYYF